MTSPVKQESLFEILTEARVGLAWIDLDGRIQEVNRAFADLLLYEPDKIVGKKIRDLLVPEDVERVERRFSKFRSGYPSFTLEIRLRNANGDRVWTYQSLVPPKDAEHGRVLWVLHDETFLQHTKKDLRELNMHLESRMRERTTELETAVQELEAYNYSVTHDLRTPLRAIRGFTDLLMRRIDQLDPETRGFVEAVHGSSREMSEIIEGLQRLSGMNRVELRRERVNISVLVREVLARLRKTEPRRRVQTKIDRDIYVRADPNLARVLVENLVTNAWKFSRLKKQARIEFSTMERDGRRFLYIRDNGVGFDPADVNKLFHPFRRLHKDRRFEGSGIGLATVRQVVRRHGGLIMAEGAKGKGAAFYFRLSRWDDWI